MSHTFEQHPPEAGQLVQGGGSWYTVASTRRQDNGLVLCNNMPPWNDYHIDCCTLLLPSKRQCKAAGLSKREALRLLPGAAYGNALSWRDTGWGGISEFHGQLAVTTEGGNVVTAERFDRMKLLIQRAEALQAWLAGWNEEATDDR